MNPSLGMQRELQRELRSQDALWLLGSQAPETMPVSEACSGQNSRLLPELHKH